MANTSATGGYLQPVGGAMPNDQELEDLLQAHVVGITGLAPEMVRPRWQPTVPRTPEIGVNWCSIGVVSSDQPDSPYFDQDEDSTTSSNHEDIEVMATFYGIDGEAMAKRFRNGLAIPQNNQQLRQHRMTFVRCMPLRPSPDLVNQQWVRRYDLAFTVRRETVESYEIQSFTTAPDVEQV